MNPPINQDASNQVGNLWPIPGFHGAREALEQDQGGIRISALWLAKGKKSGRIEEIKALAKARGIPVTFKAPQDLDRLAPGVAHQGIMALAAPFPYRSLEEIADHAFQKQGPALLVALDHITDEGNLSSLIRSAAFFGVHGMVIPKDRSAQITPTVLKRSSGACVHVPITRVVNMARALTLLNKQGFWIIGTSPPAPPDQEQGRTKGKGPATIYHFDWNRPVVLVLGNEQRGLGRAVAKQCHHMVGIPAQGRVESLNVSVAGAVILSEISRQRG